MLADCIRLAQTNNEALEALLQRFAPLIKKCGRQLHIEDGNEEMILAFIELVKDFSPSNLRNIDDGTVVQYIKQSMYHYCFRIYKKYHHVETVIGWDEISPKEEAEYLATQDKIQLNDGLLTELQIGLTYLPPFRTDPPWLEMPYRKLPIESPVDGQEEVGTDCELHLKQGSHL